MYYLKCSKCGHYNELKTEYLIFCSGCNKKLDNNFQDWSKRYPEKTFDDFKQTICVTKEEEPAPVKASVKPSYRKGLKIGLITVLTIAVCYVVGYFAGDAIVRLFNRATIDPQMLAVAEEINKSCPVQIDSDTQLDNAIALPDNVFQYTYTLLNVEKEATANIDDLKNYLEPRIINAVQSNPDLQFFRDRQVSMKYYYQDKNRVYLFTIIVKPEQYQ